MSDSLKSGEAASAGSNKTFCALNLFKWVAMLLMFAIAFGEFYLSDAADVNWIFIGFCVVFGFILLWTGHVLAKHAIAADKAHFKRKSGLKKGSRVRS